MPSASIASLFLAMKLATAEQAAIATSAQDSTVTTAANFCQASKVPAGSPRCWLLGGCWPATSSQNQTSLQTSLRPASCPHPHSRRHTLLQSLIRQSCLAHLLDGGFCLEFQRFELSC
ncbi:unnamed protein product [Prorocentrum cordatum]|uniref:Secreted protein n=1 Tax=Prorocentrum cordatum TaxID=2364126 RepID=A0ABN9S5E9_9DINO|nr:unnamed protein product [Polarella glacialis]